MEKQIQKTVENKMEEGIRFRTWDLGLEVWSLQSGVQGVGLRIWAICCAIG